MKKWVLVTGACINTGVAIGEKFASEGRNVIFTGRNADKVKLAEKNYREKFGNVEIIGYAINSLLPSGGADTESVEKLFGFIDGKGIFVSELVLNAADQGLNMKIFDNRISEFEKVLDSNVVWNYCIIEQAASRMKDNGGGSVVFINSNTAYRAIPDRIAYIASKGAQLGMMRALALDLGKYNIRVNAVLPGMIITERWKENPEWYKNVPSRFTPLGDVATGEDVAEAVWYLTAYARNATGAELVVDGGNTIQLYPLIPKE